MTLLACGGARLDPPPPQVVEAVVVDNGGYIDARVVVDVTAGDLAFVHDWQLGIYDETSPWSYTLRGLTGVALEPLAGLERIDVAPGSTARLELRARGYSAAYGAPWVPRCGASIKMVLLLDGSTQADYGDGLPVPYECLITFGLRPRR